MKVKLLVSRSGPEIGAQNVGDVIDVDKAEGKRLIESSQAIPYAPKKSTERRTKKNVGKSKG